MQLRHRLIFLVGALFASVTASALVPTDDAIQAAERAEDKGKRHSKPVQQRPVSNPEHAEEVEVLVNEIRLLRSKLDMCREGFEGRAGQ